jgi:hypothetical protein
MGKKLFFVLSLSILLISVVSAGWFSDMFKKDPSLAPVDVGVNLANSPPEIIKFIDVSALGPEYAQPFTANPTLGFGAAYLAAVVQDRNGLSDLAQGVGISPFSSIYFEVKSPTNSIVPEVTRSSISCDSYECNNPLIGSSCSNPAIQRIFVCIIPFLPNDPASSGTSDPRDLWTIQAQAIDLAANPSTIINSGDSGFDNLPTDYMQLNELSAYNLANTALNWNSLSITTPNQVASAPLTIENFGNVPLTTIQITGSDLLGTNPSNPSAKLSVTAFSASGSNGGSPDAFCVVPSQAVALTTGTVTVPSVSVPYTGAGAVADRDDIYICARQALNTPGILSGPSSISYGGTWDIIAS